MLLTDMDKDPIADSHGHGDILFWLEPTWSDIYIYIYRLVLQTQGQLDLGLSNRTVNQVSKG